MGNYAANKSSVAGMDSTKGNATGMYSTAGQAMRQGEIV